MRELNHQELKLLLEDLYQCQLAPFVWGTFGIGKSTIIHEFGAEHGMDVVDERMATIDAVDFRGIPYIDTEQKFVEWIKPKIFNRKYDDAGKPIPKLIFLDELNLAPPMTQSAAYQLILDRKLGDDIQLMDTDFVVAAGNVDNDGGATYDIVPPLSNRFFNVRLSNPIKGFLEKAESVNLHPSIIGYLTLNGHELHTYNSNEKNLINATNRSWFAFSKLLKYKESKVGNLTKEQIQVLGSGLIPEAIVTKFAKFHYEGQLFPSYQSILEGTPDRELTKENAASSIAFTIGAVQFLSDPDNARDPVKAEKISKFIFDAAPTLIYADSKVAYCRSLLHKHVWLAQLVLSKDSQVPTVMKMYSQFQAIVKET